MTSVDQATPDQPKQPSFGEAFRFWLKLGFISFGGPSGQIAIMHRELVEKKRWISNARFLHALNYCMLLPGPEAQQLATYVGWLLHRTRGGIVAGGLFVIPSIFVLWTLSYIYVVYGKVPWIAAMFYGLKPAVVAIVASAVIRIGKKALRNWVLWTIAGAAFISIFFFKVSFPIIIASAGLIGFLGGRRWPGQFLASDSGGKPSENTVIGDDGASGEHTRPSMARAVKVCAVCLALWWIPLILLGAWLGWRHPAFTEGLFFSKAAMVTFGGAYAVLPYVSQQAVEHYQWLTAGQMLDGLGLAETTPGPLIMVLQFVGFLGGWHHPGQLPQVVSATLCALITTWTTFVPCFMWIFVGAPHIEQLRGNKTLTTSLSAVTSAVVGVILNLAVWFGLHVLFLAQGVVDWFAVALTGVAFTGMQRWNWDIVPVVLGAAILGVVYKLAI